MGTDTHFVVANRPGVEDKTTFSGASVIFHMQEPTALAQLSSQEEGTLVHKIVASQKQQTFDNATQGNAEATQTLMLSNRDASASGLNGAIQEAMQLQN